MKKKILFLIESLGGGGAEKVLTTMMRHIDKECYDVSVLAICGGGKYEAEVASCVNYSCLLNRPDSYRGMSKLYYILIYKLLLPKTSQEDVYEKEYCLFRNLFGWCYYSF